MALLKIYLDSHSRWVLLLPPQHVKGLVCASEANQNGARRKGFGKRSQFQLEV